ncbi:adenosylcobinamide-phosphate synthase CbiB [Synechococcus sp. M16CYN]|uniref:adenosylcobinamide-phosphate synthase CbiB n=1 Tax=Synechococcus sp. M16CYN TaxID=3103139 RepID=UPI0030E01081
MPNTATIHPEIGVVFAAGLDWIMGDPPWLLHPVVVMGWVIRWMREFLETVAGTNRLALSLGGGLITLCIVLGSCAIGWAVERLCFADSPNHEWGWILLVVGLASALAARSLRSSVLAVVKALTIHSHDGDFRSARKQLSRIVSRDVNQLDESEILRAAAESASENAVDGIFAPLFWMIVGIALWRVNISLPGPLALVWAFKASSTLDSMLGYKIGKLQWIGTVGACLDDLLTWVPCRLVMLSLPLVSRSWNRWLILVKAAERDGAPDPSPNAGRSEAIFAHCAEVQLGGCNRYKSSWVNKPILGMNYPPADQAAILTVLNLSHRLEGLWLFSILLVHLNPASIELASISTSINW